MLDMGLADGAQNGPSEISLTPEDLRQAAAHFAEDEGTALLYSGGSLDCAGSSFLYLFPTQTVCVDSHEVVVTDSLGERHVSHQGKPWDALKNFIGCEALSTLATPSWVGYLSWEMGAYAEAGGASLIRECPMPLAYFQRCALVLQLDHSTGLAEMFLDDTSIATLPTKHQEWIQRLCQPNAWQDLAQNPAPTPSRSDGSWKLKSPLISRESYVSQVRDVQEHICAGDIYQMCLSQQFSLKGRVSPFSVFDKLATANPSPFSAYLNFPQHTIVSSSPERFLYHHRGQLETRPIKGTAPRHANPERDAQLRDSLVSSEKDKAELLMITDLMRNDLGRISTTGTVHTDELWRCEAYTNVFHLVSVIRSEADPSLHPIDMLRLSFPAGSISGCPKPRALEIIHAIEQRPRGLYTGSIGHIFANGDFDFNVAIRTMVIDESGVDIQLGGAVVYDSDPDSEYDETLHKGASIFKVLGYDAPTTRNNSGVVK